MSTSVIGIDPAPKKPSAVFDGDEFVGGERGLDAVDLSAYLKWLLDKGAPNTLICWDAPLTGPRNPKKAGEQAQDFTQRPIEQFFSRQKTGFKANKETGISVQTYSSMSHWTITRSLLGLPRVGPFDNDYPCLPFHLLPGPKIERRGRPEVVEVHPGLAAWLWCEGKRNGSWEYKKKKGVRTEMWQIIRDESGVWPSRAPEPKNDDQFDAAVGWLLGRLYVEDRGRPETERQVVILGDRFTGSFLLPRVDGLEDAWWKWWEHHSAHAAWLTWKKGHGVAHPSAG